MEVRINWSSRALETCSPQKNAWKDRTPILCAPQAAQNPRCRAWKQRLLLPNARLATVENDFVESPLSSSHGCREGVGRRQCRNSLNVC